MKFTPKLLSGNVNVSSRSALKDFFILLSGILGVLFIIYFLLGFAFDILVARMPLKVDRVLGCVFSKSYEFKELPTEIEKAAQEFLNETAGYVPDVISSDEGNFQRRYNLQGISDDYFRDFTVRIVDDEQINALALPGKHIVLFSGLVKEVQSENELAMILAHEIGHYVHRDHLRALGRGVVFVFFSSMFFGADNVATQVLQKGLLTEQLRYSRQQEQAADKFALELLYKKYGHAGGALDFFRRMEDKKSFPRAVAFFSTHPNFFDRISMLEEEIEKRNYTFRAVKPLPEIYSEKK